MKRLLLAVLLPAACALPVQAAAERADAPDSAAPPVLRTGAPAAAPVNAPARVCIGGLQHRKTIVRQVQNERTETTLDACRVDRGAPGRAPRSPTVAAGQDAIA